MQHKMTIAMIGQKGMPTKQGGIERHVEELSRALVAQGHTVIAYTRPHYTNPAITWFHGVRLVSLPSIATKHLDAGTHTFFALLHAMFILRKVDVIHIHGVGPSFLAFIPRIFRPGIKVVTTFHSPDRLHGKWGAFAKWCLTIAEWMTVTFAHETIVVSRSLHSYVLRQYGSPVLYIPNGVRMDGIAGSETMNADQLRSLFGLESGRYHVVVSRFVPHKRIEDVVDAWKKAYARYPLIIVGGSAQTDAYEARLRAMTMHEPRIRFVGVLTGSELQSVLAHAATFISASGNEGLPITVLEAMSARVPVILSDIPEHVELARDNAGILFPVGDQKMLTECMRYAEEPENRMTLKHMAEFAYQRMETEYDWRDIAEKTSRIYRQTIYKRSVPRPARVFVV